MRVQRFSEELRFRAPPGLTTALIHAAERDCATVSTFIRAAVLEKLRALGVEVPSDAQCDGRGETA